MTHPSVQQTGAVLPWRGEPRLSLYGVHIACKAAIITVAGCFLYVAMVLQIDNGALDGGAGETEVGGYGIDPRPALARGGRHALEIHIDRLCAVRQAVICVDGVKIADGSTSYVLT